MRVGVLQHSFDDGHVFIRAEELPVILGKPGIETAPSRRDWDLDLFAGPDGHLFDGENRDPGERTASEEERSGSEEQCAFHHALNTGGDRWLSSYTMKFGSGRISTPNFSRTRF